MEEAGGLVMSAHRWKTNADLIWDCHRLGYLHEDQWTLDPTYGRGLWWKRYRPKYLTTNEYHWDFRKAPFDGDGFDAIAFDPPYVCVGGRKTTTIPDFHDRFGLSGAPTTPNELQCLISDGIKEMHRILKKKGILLIKCKNYISSGKFWPGVHLTWKAADHLGMEQIDEFTHVGFPGPQSQTTQVHARQNSSTLFVFQKRR